MAKQKHEHVIIGTLTVAIPFDPTDLQSAVRAEATIRQQAERLEDVRLMECVTRMGKVPAETVAEPIAANNAIPMQTGHNAANAAMNNMPAIPHGLKR